MPLLKQAERVCLLVEAGNDAHDLLERLIARGVPAHIERFDAEARSTAEALLDQAHRAGADLLVMGAYTHSRLAEFVLGGVTREVLATADLPVLLHH
jgi:nucleotide-binding universal stress UspA family protein